MRIETVPLIIGAVVAFFGVCVLYDAWTPDEPVQGTDRRRVPRADRSRGGETAIGFGVLCLAAAMFGRDTWPYTIVSAIAGAALIVIGAWMNRRYIRGRLVRYDEPAATAAPAPAPSPPERPSQRLRIR